MLNKLSKKESLSVKNLGKLIVSDFRKEKKESIKRMVAVSPVSKRERIFTQFHKEINQ